MNRQLRNISYLLGSELARRVFGFLSVAILARSLDVDGFGQVMIGLTVLSYVVLGGSAGLHVLGTRNTARGQDASDFLPGELVGVRLVNTAVAFVIVVIATTVFVDDRTFQHVIVITASSGFLLAAFLEWYFQGKEEMGPSAIARTLGTFVYLLMLVLFVHGPDDIRVAAVAAVASDAIATGYLLYRFRASGRSLHIRVSVKLWRSLMSRAAPFGVGSVLGLVSINLPVLVVGVVLGTTHAGYFSAASKLVFFILIADRILATILLPASVRFQAVSVDTLRTQLSTALRWTLVLGVPLAVGGTILSGDLVRLVFGEQFGPSGALLGILVWYVLMTIINTVYTSAIMALGKDVRYRNVMTVGAILNVVMIAGGLMAGGLPGVAAGMVCAEGVTLLLMERAVSREIRRLTVPGFVRLAGAAGAMLLAVVLLADAHVLARVLAGAVTYVTATVLLKAVSWTDYRSLLGRLA